MTAHQPHEGATGPEAAYARAAATHERAAALELTAAEFFERNGDSEAGRRHRAAAERHTDGARADHGRASQPG